MSTGGPGLMTRPCSHIWCHVRSHRSAVQARREEEVLREMPPSSGEPSLLLHAVLIRIPGNVQSVSGDGPVLQGHFL